MIVIVGYLFVVVLVLLVAGGGTYWFALDRMLSEKPRAHETHVATTKDGWKITLYRFKREETPGKRVLLCHGAAGNHLNFASPRGDSLVDVLVEHGYDCWLVELRGSRSSTPPRGKKWYDGVFDDYLLYDLPCAIDYILEGRADEKLHWIGHSMGGQLYFAYELVHGRDKIRSAILLGAPVANEAIKVSHPDIAIRFLQWFGVPLHYIVRALMPFARRVRANLAYIPIDWDNVHPAIDARVLFSFAEMLPMGVTRETILVASGDDEWWVDHGKVDMLNEKHAVRGPIFFIYGAKDLFTPLKEVYRFFSSVEAQDKKLVVLSKENGFSADYGHLELTFGVNGRAEVFEPIVEWLDAH